MKAAKLKRGFLIVAFAAVSIIAAGYGIDPDWFAKTFLGLGQLDVSLAHICRAVMGLYLALAVFWLVCALRNTHKDAAILTVMIFAGGLLAGRLLSFAVDGEPAPLLIVYAAMELITVPLAWWIYKLPE
ncbi:DUF4345 domain-containing protein [Methyloligella sp. 2.7D]|uniref:DUF4345 domain-containing protein n=1 Tax=unclassified Methyloligella TaxID=2625955 RepID=UPI00157BB775|nr:DUF4345 domain-containing protein [Methyloligella sp. GL2]QKP76771.1 DUF4345 domain-containing protein [Methyloligella sp. GL2]